LKGRNSIVCGTPVRNVGVVFLKLSVTIGDKKGSLVETDLNGADGKKVSSIYSSEVQLEESSI